MSNHVKHWNKLLEIAQALDWEITDIHGKDSAFAWIELTEPDTGLRITLRSGGYQMSDKVEASFSPKYRDYLRYDESVPSVRFSVDKETRLCMRDVERRLLPGAREHFHRSEEARIATERCEKMRERATKMLIAAGAERPEYRSGNNGNLYFNKRGIYSRELAPNHDGSSVRMHFDSVPLDKAIQVLEMLNEG